MATTEEEPPLSLDQTLAFLKTTLHLPADIIRPDLNFLGRLIPAWAEHLPYQNINQVLITQKFGRLATREEIIRLQLAGRGGVCIHHAYFVYRVLGRLGFRVRLVPSAVIQAYDHAIVTVRDVQVEGDEYLVELGGGFPCLEAVPLHQLRNSESKTIEYTQTGLEFKYVLRGDTLSRYHRSGDEPDHYTYIPPHDVADTRGGWHRFYDCELRDFDVEEAFAPSTQIAKCLTTRDDRYFFLKHVRAVRVTSKDDSKKMMKKMIAIKGDEFLTRDDQDGRQVKPIPDVRSALTQNFPMLSADEMEEARNYIKDIRQGK